MVAGKNKGLSVNGNTHNFIFFGLNIEVLPSQYHSSNLHTCTLNLFVPEFLEMPGCFVKVLASDSTK